MRWYRTAIALFVSAVVVCPAAFGQAGDVRSRDAERERLQKMIETMQKKAPGGQAPAAPETLVRGLPAVSVCSESEMKKAAEGAAMPLPRDLTTIIVDGRKLRIKNPAELVRPEFEHPALFLPQGTHFVRFHEEGNPETQPEKATGPSAPISKEAFFSGRYAAIRGLFSGEDGKVSISKLAPNLWEAKENFQSPLTPHLLGNYHFSQAKFEAAERKYWQAIRVDPCFALSHLNLACLYAKHSRDLRPRAGVDFKARAADELHWAEEFNVGDAFGVAQAIAALRQEMNIPPMPDVPEFRLQDYQSAEAMDAADRRAVGVLNAAMKYLSNDIERAKLVNNKAVYFRYKQKNDLALGAYKEAWRVLGDAVKDPAAREVALRILDNAAALCKTQWHGGNEEFEIYKEYMQRQWQGR